jgi:cysteine desulfurase/selenocysteine lyase
MIYLDNAATSFPKPSSVYESVMKAMKVYGANPGRGSLQWQLKVQELFTKQGSS